MHLSEDGFRKLDTRLREATLLDADALGEAVGAEVLVHLGRRAAPVLLAPGNNRFTLTPPSNDWREWNMLALVLQAEKPVGVSLFVQLASKSPTLPQPDGFRSGHEHATDFSDFREYLIPYENFLIYGFGEYLYPIETITLSLRVDDNVRVYLAELRGVDRSRAAGPRLTDEGLLCELGRAFDAPAAYLTHLRTRQAPEHWFADIPAPSKEWSSETADDICRNFVHGYDCGNPLNWRVNPNGYLEWQHTLNRHGFMAELLTAWKSTGDARYVRKLDELWLSWLRANPEPVGHNGGGDPAWETLSTAVRVYSTWIRMFFVLLHEPAFDDSTRIEILKSFWAHAQHLMHYTGYDNNWLIVESQTLVLLSILFPEFKAAAAWGKTGMARLQREIGRQIFPDGADWELAPGYHAMSSRGFFTIHKLARMNDVPVPALFDERLPKTFEYLVGIRRPDGTWPSMNDSSGYRRSQGALQPYIDDGATFYNRPDLTATPEGPFAGQSRAFPDSGFHVLASGTGHNALWMLFDAGDIGASHRHEDALNLEVFAYGYPFIVDPGITGYFQDDWTAYYRQTRAHNTVLVNGRNQCRGRHIQGHVSYSVRDRVARHFGTQADVVRATYDGGYEGLPEDVRHTRAILFVRGRYWLVFDEILGDAANEIEARFQFVPLRLQLDREAGAFRTNSQSRPNLELAVVAPANPAELTIVTGAVSPVGGWVSDGGDLPAPQARIRMTRLTEQPLRMIFLLCPFAAGTESGMRVEVSEGDTARLQLAGEGGKNRVEYTWATGEVRLDSRTLKSTLQRHR